MIVISGGTKGVGRAFAETAAKEGAKLCLGGRDKNAGNEVIKEIFALNSDGIFVNCDLLNIEDCKNLFDAAYEKYGRLDGFFDYAGVTPISPLDTCDEQTFDWVMDVNF